MKLVFSRNKAVIVERPDHSKLLYTPPQHESQRDQKRFTIDIELKIEKQRTAGNIEKRRIR